MDSAVNDAARGSNANKRGMAGLVFEKGEVRPTSLRHFLASSSTRIAAAAPTACYGCESLLHLLHARTRVDSALVEARSISAQKYDQLCGSSL